jgi:hypothetical protein
MITYIILISIFILISGMCDGMAEMLKFHTLSFFKKFPKANPNYWSPNLSWTNKWKNGDYRQGEKFWQSSRALVWSTDAYHLFRMFRNVLIFISIVLPLVLPFWYLYLIGYCILYLIYTSGFSLIFDKIFK